MSLEVLARKLNLSATSISKTLMEEFAAETGKVPLAGSEAETSFRQLVESYAERLIICPADLRSDFRRFISDVSNYPRKSQVYSNAFKQSLIDEYRRLAQSLHAKSESPEGKKNDALRRDLAESGDQALALANSLESAELVDQELITLRDIAIFISKTELEVTGRRLLHLIVSPGGLNPGFQKYLMGITTEIKILDASSWRASLTPLEKIGRKADDTPRFQDIWLVAYGALPFTRMTLTNLRKLLSGPPTTEMLIKGVPYDSDANDARKNSMIVLLGDGEHELVARFLTHLASRRAGRGLLDGIVHAAAIRPLSDVSRELVARATNELEQFSSSRKDDFKGEFFLMAKRIWHLLRPLLDKDEVENMASARSADAYLKTYYKKKGAKETGGGPSGTTSTTGGSAARAGRTTRLFVAVSRFVSRIAGIASSPEIPSAVQTQWLGAQTLVQSDSLAMPMAIPGSLVSPILALTSPLALGCAAVFPAVEGSLL